MKKYLKRQYKYIQSALSSGTLTELGKIYNTDKIDKFHSFAGKCYLDIYEMYFNQFKEKEITMLEIGIRGGGSLRVFRDFFKNGKILGLDIDPETNFKEKRITTYIGSQNSPDIINKIFDENPKIKIILDDGSHINELTIASFNLIFDRLEKGGLYVIEDLANTYLGEALEEGIKIGNWPGMHLNDNSVKMVNNRSDINSFFLKMIEQMDYRRGTIEYVHFWSQLCIIKKID